MKVTLATITTISVENPHYSRAHDGDGTNPRMIQAAFNPRESYAGYLYARSSIDEAEWQAAGVIRRAFEMMGGAGAQAMDYTKEPVDGGQIAQTIRDEHLRAARTLREALGALGPVGYDITLKLAGEGRWPEELSPHAAVRKRIGDRFRECLDTLAVQFGFKARPMRSLTGT